MRYGPWPQSGRLLRHFVFFFLLPALSRSWRSRPCQGCAGAPSGARPALDVAPPGLHCCRGRKSAAATGGRVRLPGAGHCHGAPLPRRAVRGRSTRLVPRCPAAHSPASKRPFVQPRSAATDEGCGGTLPPRCPQAHARAASGTCVGRPVPRQAQGLRPGPPAPRSGRAWP